MLNLLDADYGNPIIPIFTYTHTVFECFVASAPAAGDSRSFGALEIRGAPGV